MELYELNNEEILNEILDRIDEKIEESKKEENNNKGKKETLTKTDILNSKKNKFLENKAKFLKFFDIIEKINESRIESGLIDIRKNFFDQAIIDLSVGDTNSFWIKIWKVKDNRVTLDDMRYNKEKREFTYIKSDVEIELTEEKINLLINWAEISTNKIPYVATWLWNVLEYDDWTFVYLDNNDFKISLNTWKIFLSKKNDYDENIYIYTLLLDLERTIDYNFNLLLLFWLNWFVNYYSAYVSDEEILDMLIEIFTNSNLLSDIKSIAENSWLGTNFSIWTQGAYSFIDVSADNFNKYMEKLFS